MKPNLTPAQDQPAFLSRIQHPEVAEKIWKQLPASGPATTVQGELLRVIEHLRNEAQKNANANFGKSDKLSAIFVRETLVNSGVFEKEVAEGIRFAAGKLMKVTKPYMENDVYDYLVDRICVFCMKNEEGIAYEGKGEQDS